VTDLLTCTQIELLADLLDAVPASLASLEHLGAAGVYALRNRVSDALFDSMASTFSRVSKLAPLVPNALVIATAQKSVPAEVAGRAGGALGLAHEDRAVGVLSGMKPAYLADAASYVDPRIIPHFAPKLPARLLIPTAKELLRRKDYLTASRFVEFATDELIVEFEKAIDDDEGIARTGALVFRTDVLNQILRVARPKRLVRMAASAAAGSADFVVAVLSVLSRIEPDVASPGVDELLGNPNAESVSRVLDIAVRHDAVGEVLDLSTLLAADRLHHLAAASDVSVARQIEGSADTAGRRKAWKRLQRAMPAAASAKTDN